jgi:carboxypeptidase PM20D1
VCVLLLQEVSGDGAKAVASLLTARGVTFDFVLDEGLMVLNGVVPSHEKPVAMVGVVEKVGRDSAA